ncbi:translation initiation factor IF-2-like [Helianthus annuus]|uniref:translation initiation factor IF-2-like n=1 Tax=Helianthus annuus TaxID=4232 RepID=UPI0016531B9B|nr:translation initiation factor IF-2-like [Helianthus annuus]
MQGDDISNDPSACKEILGGLGTPFEVERARSSIVANAILEYYKALGRREEEAARLRAEAEELVKAIRAGAEQLERDRAAFDKQKQTAEWAAANVALGKEKAAAEVIAVKAQHAEARAVKALEEAKEAGARVAKALEEAKERESRSAKALEEANVEPTRLDQVVASLQAEVQTREVAVTDLTARMTAAEERANATVEARDALTSSLQQLEADCE